jgi:threonine dehydratase
VSGHIAPGVSRGIAEGQSDYVTLDEIRAARERIRPAARVTPMIEAGGLWLKAESLQPMGAFKIRGAYNMIAQLPKEQLDRGVITYSSGNHGQAVALAAQQLGAKAVIVMPTTAPQVKIDGCKSYGAEVIMAGTTSLDRQARAEQEARERGLTIVPPFDHKQIITGRSASRSSSSAPMSAPCSCRPAAADSPQVPAPRSSRSSRRCASLPSNRSARRR